MPTERHPANTGSAARPSTAALIAQLARDVPPVRRVWPPYARLAMWLALELGIVAAAVLALGVRADLADKLAQAGFAVELLLLLAVGLASALFTLLAAVPGREPARALALGASAVVIAGIGILYFTEPATVHGGAQHLVATGWRCAARTAVVAALPWLLLLVAVRRGATFAPGLAGLLAGVASFFVAAVALRVICASDERWHLLVFHLAPVALGAAVSVALGHAWLARWRRRT